MQLIHSHLSHRTMKNLVFCILVVCAAILPRPGAAQATLTGVQLNVCSSANGYACLSSGTTGAAPGPNVAGTWATCTDYKVTGLQTACADLSANYLCYPGAEGSQPRCGPQITAKCTAAGNFTAGRCKNYYTCIMGSPSGNPSTQNAKILMACPEGEEFSVASGRCTAKAVAGCSLRAPSGRLFFVFREVDPTSCRHYFKSSLLGGRVRVQCPFGLLFDTTFRTCRVTTNCGTRPR